VVERIPAITSVLGRTEGEPVSLEEQKEKNFCMMVVSQTLYQAFSFVVPTA
jgi:hypothetical protein